MRATLHHASPEDGPATLSEVIITLSRRNLMALLKMLDEGRLAGALSARDQDVEILVQAQEDEFHYADREAGVMSWEVMTKEAYRG